MRTALTKAGLDRATILGGLIGLAACTGWVLLNPSTLGFREDPVFAGAQLLLGMIVSFGTGAIFGRVIPVMSSSFGQAGVLLFLVGFSLLSSAYAAWSQHRTVTLAFFAAGLPWAVALAIFALLVNRVAGRDGKQSS